MTAARHEMPPEIATLSLDEIADRYIGCFRDKVPDWEAFEDAKIEGYSRAQHRFIGAGGSGKHDDPNRSRRAASRSASFLPPGQGNAAHTHEVEEVFFVLQGHLTVFIEDESGRRLDRKLGAWECIACPPGVIHGFQNDSLEPVYIQVMLGRGRPETMGYKDEIFTAAATLTSPPIAPIVTVPSPRSGDGSSTARPRPHGLPHAPAAYTKGQAPLARTAPGWAPFALGSCAMRDAAGPGRPGPAPVRGLPFRERRRRPYAVRLDAVVLDLDLGAAHGIPHGLGALIGFLADDDLFLDPRLLADDRLLPMGRHVDRAIPERLAGRRCRADRPAGARPRRAPRAR